MITAGYKYPDTQTKQTLHRGYLVTERRKTARKAVWWSGTVFYLCEQLLAIWVIQECANFTVDCAMTAASLWHELKSQKHMHLLVTYMAFYQHFVV